jgi:hypothetical protein
MGDVGSRHEREHELETGVVHEARTLVAQFIEPGLHLQHAQDLEQLHQT